MHTNNYFFVLLSDEGYTEDRLGEMIGVSQAAVNMSKKNASFSSRQINRICVATCYTFYSFFTNAEGYQGHVEKMDTPEEAYIDFVTMIDDLHIVYDSYYSITAATGIAMDKLRKMNKLHDFSDAAAIVQSEAYQWLMNNVRQYELVAIFNALPNYPMDRYIRYHHLKEPKIPLADDGHSFFVSSRILQEEQSENTFLRKDVTFLKGKTVSQEAEIDALRKEAGNCKQAFKKLSAERNKEKRELAKTMLGMIKEGKDKGKSSEEILLGIETLAKKESR